MDESSGLLNIKQWRRCVTIDEFFTLFHPYAGQSKSITKLLAQAKKVWLLVVTIGEGLECKSKEYFNKNEFFRGYIMDRLGSFLVEEEAKKIDLEISRKCQEDDYATTRRYSPGYSDFSIKAQQIFFNLVKDAIPELKISPGYLLSPEKTVTAVKGMIKV
ncbi:MAG: hypothetical protein JRK26_26060 [Deltaproteobacteria bacterium]|nr:hypothetical protein [Deltaproteobacteria bacterium]